MKNVAARCHRYFLLGDTGDSLHGWRAAFTWYTTKSNEGEIQSAIENGSMEFTLSETTEIFAVQFSSYVMRTKIHILG